MIPNMIPNLIEAYNWISSQNYSMRLQVSESLF